MDITKKVAIMRLNLHANMISLNNVLNQLHIISNEKAEERNKKHVSTIFTDILPRLGKDVSEYVTDGES